MRPPPPRPKPKLTLDRLDFVAEPGRTLKASPFVMHFGGYQVGKAHRQVLRIQNSADFSHGVHIIPPGTPYFRAHCPAKRGTIAPGMSEEIVIEFCPDEYRYFYDCVRVHSEEVNLLVPLHGYPTVNKSKFPSEINFGACEVGRMHERRFTLECNVPIPFEFSLEIPDDCEHFQAGPLQGEVPANGTADIVVRFRPSKAATSVSKIELNVAEFNAKPLVCRLTGLGATRAQLPHASDRAGAGKSPPPEPQTAPSRRSQGKRFERPRPPHARKAETGPRAGGPGAGRGGEGVDPGVLRRMVLHQESELGGLRIPPLSKMFTHSGVNSILIQKEGLLGTKEMKSTIQKRRKQEDQDYQEAVAQANASSASGLDPFDDWTIPGAHKGLLFARAMNEAKKMELMKDLQNVVALGEETKGDEEIERIEAVRKEQQAKLQAVENLKYLEKTETEYHTEPHPQELSRTNGFEAFQPEFKKKLSDELPIRGQSIEVFVKNVRKLLVHNRLAKRLTAIKALLDKVGRDKSKLAKLVAEESLGAAGAGERGAQSQSADSLAPPAPEIEQIVLESFPVCRESDFQVFKPVEVPEMSLVRKSALPLKYKDPFEYKMLGYAEEEFEPLCSHMPTMDEVELLEGATEEYDWRCGEPNIHLHEVPPPEKIFGGQGALSFLAGPAGTGAVQLQPPERSWDRDVFLPNIPNSRYDLDLLGADGFRQMAERRPKNPPFFRERIGEMTIRALSESNEHTETLSDNWMLSTLAHSGESFLAAVPGAEPRRPLDDEDSDEEASALEQDRRLQCMPDVAQIRRELIPAEWLPADPKAETAAGPDGAGGPLEEEQERDGGAGPAEDPCSSEDPLWMMSSEWLHPREAALDALEASAMQKRLDRIAALDAGVETLNSKVKKKCLYGVQLRDSAPKFKEELFRSEDCEAARNFLAEHTDSSSFIGPLPFGLTQDVALEKAGMP